MNNSTHRSPLYKCVEKKSYRELVRYLGRFGDGWVFRGQGVRDELTTTLERECLKSGFNLKDDAGDIEDNIIRRFRRVYDGDHQELVRSDTLYCLSVMRHFGAPTRLLDFSYSQHVATYFALERAYDDVPNNEAERNLDGKGQSGCAVWCVRAPNLVKKVKEKYQKKERDVEQLIDARIDDSARNDTTFVPLYMNKKLDFVLAENPLRLHNRLHLQQGVHLCPGNIERGFMDNLLLPYSGRETNDVVKVTCLFNERDLTDAFRQHWRMSVTRESLFPGLDGFAQSMKYQMWLHKKSADWRKNL